MKSNKWIVLKFGGTSVSQAIYWQTIAAQAEKKIADGLTPILVCSALSGVSNKLEKLVEQAIAGSYKELLDDIKEQHQKLSSELEVDFPRVLGGLFEELEKLCCGLSLLKDSSPKIVAKVLAFGEILSTNLGEAYLSTKMQGVRFLSAGDYLKSETLPGESEEMQYLSARCNYQFDQDLGGQIAKTGAKVLITQGFLAQNEHGETFLLGRGGSDTSASYFASKLGAKALEIWTDVPGIFTANPHRVSSARLLLTLDYDEAQELASSGAKVLHPRCLEPVKCSQIPLHIKWTRHPDVNGTVIKKMSDESGALVKAVSTKDGVHLITMDTLGMWQNAGFLGDIFTCFGDLGLSVDLVATSESHVTVSLDRQANVINGRTIDRLLHKLGKYCRPKHITGCASVSLVGRNIRAILHELSPAMDVFQDKKVFLLTQAASDLNFTVVVEEDEAVRLEQSLHELFLRSKNKEGVFGPHWNRFFEKEDTEREYVSKMWWVEKQSQILDLASKNSTPFYLYDLSIIDRHLNALMAVEGLDQVYYAMKANDQEKILSLVRERGGRFDCVSIEEVRRLREIFSDLKGEEVLFTPNFASNEEYKEAVAFGCFVTLDNIYPLQEHASSFKGAKLLIRVDPGTPRGHHPHVRTAGKNSKFGVSVSDLELVRSLEEEHGLSIIGLHAHVGSGVRGTTIWRETAAFLMSVAKDFPNIKILDLGGGLGVVEKPGDEPLDMNAFAEELNQFKKAFPYYELWIEPGRYLVSEAGVLLSRVNQLKDKEGKNYIGIDSGMSTLIRPALYSAYHHIVNLSALGEEPSVLADVVGTICESGDVVGHARRLPSSKEGDIFLVANCGAYGRVMSSEYNRKPLPQEIIFE